jgi:predicted dehydrogenase
MANQSTRRDFLKTTSVATAAGAGAAYFPWTQKAFANQAKNDRPIIGCIGVGSMGTGDARGHARYGDIVAVCDVDSNHANRARNDKNIGKGKADVYEDYRKVLERKDIDVVSVVTPDHWHVKIAIEALKAGKHVFCQKPLTLTIEESKLIRKAVKDSGKVFQVGTQQRSQTRQFLTAIALCHDGRLGKLQKVQVAIGGGPTSGKLKKEDPPKNLNWEKWLGQTPLVDYIPKRCHYQFRWWYEYSGGKMTDWGAHHVDIATWGIDQNGPGQGPTTIEGTSTHPVPLKDGVPTADDQYNTATAFSVKCQYPNGVEMTIRHDSRNGVLFEGDKGRIFVSRGRLTGAPVEQLKKNPLPEDALVKLYKGKKPTDHKGNFFQCIREGGEPVSDVASHVQAINTCHLANIAIRLGRKLTWDAKAEKIVGDDAANAWLSRPRRKGYEIDA